MMNRIGIPAKIAAACGICISLLAADESHYRVVDDFMKTRPWTSEVVDDQQQGPFYQVGIWSDPIDGPTFVARNGKGYFHFPQLEAWVREGFEYAWHLQNKNGDGLQEFDGENVLSFNISNQGPEAVRLKFRLFEDMSYTFSNQNGTVQEDALEEMVTQPETFIIEPHAAPRHIRIRLSRPVITEEEVSNPIYKNQIKFFTFEATRTIAPSKNKPTIDCTLVMDNLRIEDGTVSK